MNIYVGNLSFRTTEAELEELFGAYGSIDRAAIIKDRESGRSKGFGFIEMSNDDEARKAIEALDGHSFLERNIRVNEARPREDRPRSERRSW